jgi:hypothetical protein
MRAIKGRGQSVKEHQNDFVRLAFQKAASLESHGLKNRAHIALPVGVEMLFQPIS